MYSEQLETLSLTEAALGSSLKEPNWKFMASGMRVNG